MIFYYIVRDGERYNFHTDGARTSDPSLGQRSPRTDPEQVYVLSPSLLFSFRLQVRVKLTYNRLSIFLGTLSGMKLVFFPTYPRTAGHSEGDKSGAPLLTKFLDTILALGQFTILSRVRQFRVRGFSQLSLSMAVFTSIFKKGAIRIHGDCRISFIK